MVSGSSREPAKFRWLSWVDVDVDVDANASVDVEEEEEFR